MKRRLFILMLIGVFAFSITACGSESSNTQEAATVKIDKTVDSIAAELGLENKQEKSPELIGASDGAAYDGNIEIYIYEDTGSESYQKITGDGIDLGITVVKAAASNDGAILVYSGEDEPDQDIITKFNSLSFN